ncbi:hypothetical protein SAMN05216510_3590 [Pseudomonas coleopterorum]|nr:hypothetical protein SAMN05216510_3590 [Pseudomonas coleopterorum]
MPAKRPAQSPTLTHGTPLWERIYARKEAGTVTPSSHMAHHYGSGSLPAKRLAQSPPSHMAHHCGSGSLPAKRPAQSPPPSHMAHHCGSGSLPAKRPAQSPPLTHGTPLWERVSAREEAGTVTPPHTWHTTVGAGLCPRRGRHSHPPSHMAHHCGSGSLPAKRPAQSPPSHMAHHCGSGSMPAKRPAQSPTLTHGTPLWERGGRRALCPRRGWH